MRGWVCAAVLAVGLVGAGGVSCSKKPAATALPPAPKVAWPTPMKVVVSIPPLKGLIEPLLPPGSTVTVLIQPGMSEHGSEITSKQLSEAINADLLVWIGGMEAKVDTLSKENRRAGRVDLRLADAMGIEVHEDEHDHDGHDHGKHEHAHGEGGSGGEGDPHVWLDPQQARAIVVHVGAKVLTLRDAPIENGLPGAPERAAAAQLARLDALDKEYKEGLASAKVRTIVVGHDAYGWLARRYDLKTVAISGLSAGEPTQADMQKAKEAVRANGLKAVFKEPQLGDAAAKRIAEETGVQVLTLDPLGDGDYFKMMRANLEAIKAALGVEK